MKSKIQLLTAVALTMAGVQSAQAVTVYALSTRDQLVTFDSATPTSLMSANFISGLGPNESLLGFDFRPANGMLYGLSSAAKLYTINTMNGQATFVASLFNSSTMAPLLLNGVEFGIDFNPVPDRLRVTSNLGQNLRINVATGATIVDGTLNQTSGMPHIVASAYTNNFAGTTSTTLYNLDSNSDTLTIQSPPNAGGQVMVGPLGMDITALAGMDIMTVGSQNMAFAAVQVAGMQGSKFASVNLSSGALSVVGNIGLNQTSDSLAIRDIAINPVPEPASMTALGMGVLALLRRKQKSSK